MNSTIHILVVADDAEARAAIEAFLKKDAYSLDFVQSGRNAIERLEHSLCDLVLCDLSKPGLSAFDVCRILKGREEWGLIPILMLTALDGDDDMVRGIEAGADDVLVKPAGQVVLRARVRALLRIRENYSRLLAGASDLDFLLRERRDQISDTAGLSEREREALDLILRGQAHHDISKALGITVRTSKFHLESILRKLGADSRVDLTRIFL